MVYPIIFIHGELGWGLNLKLNSEDETNDRIINNNTRKNVTQLQYYCYRSAIRDGFSALHRARKLFHQIIVDYYLRVEANRLNYYIMHQKELRVDNYSGLIDYVENTHDNDSLGIGKLVILPSTFVVINIIKKSYFD
jgi:hypothetical protein